MKNIEFYQGKNGGVYLLCNNWCTELTYQQVCDLHIDVCSLEGFDNGLFKEHYADKIAKRATTHNLYICPECNHFVERFERSHGNNEIKHCKWCGCKMVYEAR